MSWYPQWGPVTDDIGKMAKIQLFHVGFDQKDGSRIVHIDGKCPFYHAYSRGVKRKNRQNSSENVMPTG